MDINPPRQTSRQSGFTLVETITTLTVSLIILAAGVPAMQQISTSNRMSASINTMATHLHLARSEAIKRGLRAMLCPSADAKTCVSSSEWQGGYILFADNNANRKRDAGEELLRVHQPESQPINILTTNGRKWIRYQPSGEAPGSNVTITFCDPNEKIEPKAIIISNTGRPRFAKTKHSGDPLEC